MAPERQADIAARAATMDRPAKQLRATVKDMDPSSLSNFEVIRVTNSNFELDVNMDKKTIEGYVQLDAVIEADNAPQELVLDTNSLIIYSVTLVAASKHPKMDNPADQPRLNFHLSDPYHDLGSALHISLPSDLELTRGSVVSVGVRFATTPSSHAIQFLAPEQTAGKKYPYMFTQCQPILARQMVPCQDSPGAKMTYSAVVRVPKPLTALMSALEDKDSPKELPHLQGTKPSYETNVFTYKQPVPIASYLLALAVGELACKDLGPRSRIWAEPSQVAAGAWEFEDTDKYLQAGEELAGEYVWGRYDLLLLPPTFPYGGMENPCLTFVTPTLIAGDRSLTNVVAHEIAHSWTGNLVTNASWEHFWLNEGFTMILERKIVGKLQGPAMFQLQAMQGFLELAATVQDMGADNPYTALVPKLDSGDDPDVAFSIIPYEKGFSFLYYLQELVGGESRFNPFLLAYIRDHRQAPLTTDQFKEYFLNYFKDVPAVKDIDWLTWLYAPGMPPVTNKYDESLAQKPYDLALKWHTCDAMGIASDGPPGASAADIEGWTSDQMIIFLNKLGEYRAPQPMSKAVAQKLAHTYDIYKSRNAEILCSFFNLAIHAKDQEVLPHVADMLRNQGRLRYLKPLFSALFKTGGDARKLALQVYGEMAESYHPVAKAEVAAMLDLTPASTHE